MNASKILEDQIIHVKRGRLNAFGFEPAWNAYFDFYLSPRYLNPPLLRLEDVTFHLFLRKNLNDKNPDWQMPTIRQMKKRLSISYDRLHAMMVRLEQAQLLKKVSGFRQGSDGENIPNHYILSDPIQSLEEFLVVAAEGVFGVALKEEWLRPASVDPCPENRDTLSRNSDQSPVPEIGTLNILKKHETVVWDRVLEQLKPSMPSATFASFLQDTKLLSLAEGVAVITTDRPHTVDWLRNRLGPKIKRAIECELRLLDTPQAVTELRFEFV